MFIQYCELSPHIFPLFSPLPRLATGAVFEDEPILLQLYDSPTQFEELQGTAMEITDLASPTVAGLQCTSSVQVWYVYFYWKVMMWDNCRCWVSIKIYRMKGETLIEFEFCTKQSISCSVPVA